MREKGKIAASIMCSGFDQVMDYVHEFERNNIEFLHVDVMDGTFVPNLAYGPDFVKRLRKKTDITLDCHLMVDRAEISWTGLISSRESMCPCTMKEPVISRSASIILQRKGLSR